MELNRIWYMMESRWGTRMQLSYKAWKEAPCGWDNDQWTQRGTVISKMRNAGMG